jgi:hypothetical protein
MVHIRLSDLTCYKLLSLDLKYPFIYLFLPKTGLLVQQIITKSTFKFYSKVNSIQKLYEWNKICHVTTMN